MRKLTIALSMLCIATVAACGGNCAGPSSPDSAASAPNHGIGWSYTEGAKGALRVRAVAPSVGTSMNLAQVTDMAEQVKTCIERNTGRTDLYIPAALVVFTDNASVVGASDDDGIFWPDTMTIGIYQHDHDSRVMSPLILAHELVHAITAANGLLNNDQETHHESPLFMACGTYQGVHRPDGWTN